MKRMAGICKSHLSEDSVLRQKLAFLRAQYQVLSEKELAEVDNEDNFFSSILSTITDIQLSISVAKTELWSEEAFVSCDILY